MIYCVYIEKFKFVKFGYTSSNDIEKRISELQTGCPYEIFPVFIVEGTLRQEQELHKALFKAFGRCCIPIPPNEWYPGTNFLIKFVLNTLVKNNGNANHALALLDQFDPSLNYRKPRELRNGKERVMWPISGSNKHIKNYSKFIKFDRGLIPLQR